MPHYIKPNHGTQIPHDHLFFDTETVSTDFRDDFGGGKILSWRLGCASYVEIREDKIDREVHARFTDPDELKKFILERVRYNRPLVLWAHNLGFDFTIARLWEWLENGTLAVGVTKPTIGDQRFKGKRPFKGYLCLEGRPTMIRGLCPDGKLFGCDLGNILPVSLERIGEALGLPKWPYPGEGAADDVLMAYCERDVAVLQAAVVRLLTAWRQGDCGVWQRTLGQLAMTSWRHLMPRTKAGKLKHSILPLRHLEADPLEREAYFGGWIEALYFGTPPLEAKPVSRRSAPAGRPASMEPIGPFYVLDVQSCYAAMMRKNLFPTKRTSFRRFADLNAFRQTTNGANAIARVLLNTETDWYFTRAQGRMVRCVGRFWTTLAGPELFRALSCGHVEQVREHATYDLAPIFTEFVDYWWKRRRLAAAHGDEFDRLFSGLILKSIHGKLGQKGGHWQDAPNIIAHCDWGSFPHRLPGMADSLKCRAIASHTQIWADPGPPEWGMPCISAFTTSYVRLYMEQLIDKAGWNHVYHISTDSLLVDQTGYSRLNRAGKIKPDKLGALKIEAQGDTLAVRGQNNYDLPGRSVRAGAWKRAKEKVGGGHYYDYWEQLATIVQQRPDGTVWIRYADLEDSKPTEKGSLLTTGFTEPRRLMQTEEESPPIHRGEERWTGRLWDDDVHVPEKPARVRKTRK